MTTPATDGDQPGGNASGTGNGPPTPKSPSKTKRARWATRKLTVKSGRVKRLSLLGRHTKGAASEKKRASGGSESLRQPGQGDNKADTVDESGPGPRTLYFNLPLPDALKDEEGAPAQTYARNKIRTAKYTPLSFIPKNLYYQFQNIANIFFLFSVILVVSSSSPPSGYRTAGHSPPTA